MLIVLVQMSADVARSYGGDGGGEDRPLHTMYPAVAWVALLTEVRISGLLQRQTKAQFRRQGSRQGEYLRQDPEPFLKGNHGYERPVPIQFDLRDKQTVMPLGNHAAHWSSYIEETSTTQEYPSLIGTFFMAHTVNEEFLRNDDRRIYEEMRRSEATGTYTNDEINRLARGSKQRGHILGVGRVLPARATTSLMKVVPTARRLEMSLSGVCTAIEEMMKKLPVKDRWQLH
nr:F-box domain, leucine-rich repeat domain, L domain-like protein [Tanacetum cinerariifolium]